MGLRVDTTAEPQSDGDAATEWSWDLAVPNGGLQRWVQRGKAFVAVRLLDEAAKTDPLDVSLDVSLESPLADDVAERLGVARTAACLGQSERCSRLLPGVFAHCPFCGQAALAPLPRPQDGPAAPAWSRAAAGGSASLRGVRLTPPGGGSAVVDAAVEPAKRGSLPSGGPFLFVMAGQPPVTLAVDMATGTVWRPDPDRWRRVAALGAGCGLPAWSRAAAPLGTGIAVPLDQGAVWAETDGPYRRSARFEGGPAVGGAAVLLAPVAEGAVALVPTRVDGRLTMAWIAEGATRDGRAQAGRGWAVAPVAGAEPGETGPFGKPLATPAGAVWAGADGFLSVRLGADGPLAVWRSWPAGCRGLPWSRPHGGDHGVAHQLVRLDDRSGYMAIAMPLPNERGEMPAAVQGVRLDGPFTSTGDTAFYLHLRCRGLPWRRASAEFVAPGSIVLPLMAFGPAAPSGGASGGALGGGEQILYATVQDPAVVTGDAAGAPPTGRSKATLFLHRPGLERVPLLSGLPIATLHDLHPFLLGGRLCLYDEQGAAWHRWDLSPTPAG